MKMLRFFPIAFVALFLTLFMTSCDVIGDIFAAGAYTGIIGVVLVVAVLCQATLRRLLVPIEFHR